MKHIKLFEELTEVNVGDYILTDSKYFTNKQPRIGKIVDTAFSNERRMLKIILNTGQDMWIIDDMVVRKLKTEEIEQYEIDINTNKYNL